MPKRAKEGKGCDGVVVVVVVMAMAMVCWCGRLGAVASTADSGNGQMVINGAG
jgi:hypothetical protein